MTQLYAGPRTLLRGQTRELWGRARTAEIQENADAGYTFFDDFDSPFVALTADGIVGKWHWDEVAANSALTHGAGTEFGAIVLSTATTHLAHLGCQLVGAKNILLKPGREVFFECLMSATEASASDLEIFIGLAAAATGTPAIADTGALSVAAAGIMIEDGTVHGVVRGSSTTTNGTSIVTGYIGAAMKVGFAYLNPYTIVPYINGVRYPAVVASTKADTYFPATTTYLAPTIYLVTVAADAASSLTLDWVQVSVNGSPTTLSA